MIPLIELFLDLEENRDAVNAISFVKQPAIEKNFIALSQQTYTFETVDQDQKIIVGYALIPNKKILRGTKEDPFHIFFKEQTVKDASHLYLSKLNGNNTTVNHNKAVSGVSVVESWIVEDPKNDKINNYNLEAIKGGWAVIMKVDNEEVWEDVKKGTYLGLSIEGIFSDRAVSVDLESEAPKSALEQVLEVAKKDVKDMTPEEAEGLLKIVNEVID